ncbi:hypothetical protein BWQ96_00818 [Gracilariopsis chorda]|uniref:Uncharacterized protein n=1 Tax=Gracilariopsis chorda TaxID=448386 RepID=A0A2V3J5V1_9FLOR|nr:hypothetical protein BWQ96_00818 [Gracilariopsis chorda]|eukprot:PXF49502.1 hypothetical protein BWQ96_00818 [Gracilariopsis chorda]
MLLLKCVRTTDAHRAKHGDHDRKYEEVRSAFIENIPGCIWKYQCQPSIKTLRDKMRTMMAQRRKENREDTAASGIAEELTDFERLLDELIAEKEDHELFQFQEREAANAKEQKLVETGKIIQKMALEKKRSREEGTARNLDKSDHRPLPKPRTSNKTVLHGDQSLNNDVREQLEENYRLEER